METEAIAQLLEKYNHFRYEQIRTVKQLSSTHKIVTVVVLDDEGEDVQHVEFEFRDIKNSKILVDSVLSLLDMTDGITLLKENDLYGFALGSGTAMLHVNNAPMYIIASEVEVREL